jgi:hypothetical protein
LARRDRGASVLLAVALHRDSGRGRILLRRRHGDYGGAGPWLRG